MPDLIAVTGAAGFIGSNLAHRLAHDGHDLMLVDREVTPAKAPNLSGLDQSRLRPAGDVLRHDQFLVDLEAGRLAPAAIFHLGACSRTTETNWEFLQEINIRYTQRLWNWCAANTRPLIYASSAATYGDGKMGFNDRTPPSELKPLNLYGKSKNDFDQWALEQVAAGRPAPPRWAGVKFFNVYGPREDHKGDMRSVVNKAYAQICDAGVVKLFKSYKPEYRDGEQVRDFVYVKDAVDVCLWFGENWDASGIYNVGTGTCRTWLDLARATFAAMGREPKIEFIDMPESLRPKYQYRTEADISKLRAAGYDRLMTSLEDGIKDYVTSWLQKR